MIEAALAKYAADHVDGLVFDPDGVAGNMFVGTMPSEPEVAVMVLATGGRPNPGPHATDLPTVQFLVRSSRDPRVGKQLARRIYEELANLHDVVLDPGGEDEVYVFVVNALQTDPADAGLDDNERRLWSINFEARARALSSHRT